MRVLPSVVDGTVAWTEQDESLVTHAAKISKQEMKLDSSLDAQSNVRRVFASSDAAPARCQVAGKPLRVLSAAPADEKVEPGRFAISGKRLLLGCADGSFEVLEVKPDGKRAMPAPAWTAGQRDSSGEWGLLQ